MLGRIFTSIMVRVHFTARSQTMRDTTLKDAQSKDHTQLSHMKGLNRGFAWEPSPQKVYDSTLAITYVIIKQRS